MWALKIYLHHSSKTISHSAVDTLPHGHWVEFSMDLPWHKPMAISPLTGHSAILCGCGNMNTPIKQSSRQGFQFLNSSLTQCSGSLLSLSSLWNCFVFLFQFPSTYYLLALAEIKFLSSARYKKLVKMETFTSFQKQESFNHSFCLYYPLKFKCEAKTLQHYE